MWAVSSEHAAARPAPMAEPSVDLLAASNAVDMARARRTAAVSAPHRGMARVASSMDAARTGVVHTGSACQQAARESTHARAMLAGRGWTANSSSAMTIAVVRAGAITARVCAIRGQRGTMAGAPRLQRPGGCLSSARCVASTAVRSSAAEEDNQISSPSPQRPSRQGTTARTRAPSSRSWRSASQPGAPLARRSAQSSACRSVRLSSVGVATVLFKEARATACQPSCSNPTSDGQRI